MKFRSLSRFSLLVAALVLLAPLARAEDEAVNKTTVRFSDAAKPGTLRVDLPFADIRITGADTDTVTIATTMPEKGKGAVDEDGFRRLDDEATFEVAEKNNVITVALTGQDRWHGHGADFVITVPRRTNIVVEGENNHGGGDVVIAGVEGDVDVSSMNGDVELRDLVGAAVVNSMNGEILAHYKAAPAKPVSLVSMNGEIDLRLPADTKANLKMSSFHGSIRTNFPGDVLKSKTESAGRGFSFTGRGDSDEIRAAAREAARHAQAAAEAARESREHARENLTAAKEKARDAARIATEVSEKVTREVSREIAREVRAAVAAAPEAPETPETPRVARAPRPPRVPGFGGKTVSGALNGGGVDITLSSMNGTITVRQIK